MKIQWGRAWAGAVTAQVAQVAATVVWVAIYSYFINPGQPVATYQAHAEVAGPWVSIIAGAPIFYAASRWIAKSRSNAMALFGIMVVTDVALTAAFVESWSGLPYALFGLSYLSKFFVCALGGRHA